MFQEATMDVLHTHCAGLDVYKQTVVAAVRVPEPKKKRGWQVITRTFGTMTADLLALSDWLLTQGVTHAAMESTGEYWKPGYNILEANFELLLVNPHHIKAVPGRKTDVNDAEWIAELRNMACCARVLCRPRASARCENSPAPAPPLCVNGPPWRTACKRFWKAPISNWAMSLAMYWGYRGVRC
jgi:hypothetical protein